MDLIKIGHFIQEKRKEKALTQETLAEKLYVTDRAVSKWERGLSLPDADKMLDLCDILGINVNELLLGEKVDMKDNKKTEELLVEMTKQEEAKNRRLLADMWVLMISALMFYLIIVWIAVETLEEGAVLGTVICLSTILLVLVAFYAFKNEIDAGYYECRRCHHKHIPKYFVALVLPHINLTRFLKCPKCHKWSWSKKVLK